MANRPSSRSKAAKKPKKSQAEINRIKPAGVMSLDVLEQKSSAIKTINIKLPDGEVYEFYHLPMTVGMSERFVEEIGVNRVKLLRENLADLLVNKDGTPFVADEDGNPDSTQLQVISMDILNGLYEAINASDREEPGED